MSTAVVCLLLVPATVAAGYYAILTAVGWRPPRVHPAGPARTRFAVLVPAHDEEATLPVALRSVAASRYPCELVRVVVVADNCTDRTAAAARREGAACVERHDPGRRGKGYAVAFGLPFALRPADPPDAVLLLDADCTLHPDALRELDAVLAAGAEVVQAAVRMGDPDAGPAGLVMAVGSELENAVQAGLSRLGGGVRLRGTGMAFRPDVFDRVPWAATGPAEDAEYTAALRAAGVRVTFVPAAGVRNSPPPDATALTGQRRRWRAALSVPAATPLDRLLASKPLVLAHLALTAAGAAAVGVTRPGPTAAGLAVWAVGLVFLTAAVYLRAAGRAGLNPGAAARAWAAPLVVAQLAVVAAAGAVIGPAGWVRTRRAT